MADSKTLEPKSLAQKDAEAIDKYNRILRKTLEREEKMNRKWAWRGSSLPPFNIEHMPFERQRLAGAGMTPEDRALRKQWLQDQVLSHNEPREIPELKPRNIFRRMWNFPWDVMHSAVKPVVGVTVARHIRILVPKVVATLAATWLAWYNVKYAPASWESIHGWHIFTTKPRAYPGDPEWPRGHRKEVDDFYDKGFKERQAFQDPQTSS